MISYFSSTIAHTAILSLDLNPPLAARHAYANLARPVVLRNAPIGRYPAVLPQTQKGSVDRSFIQLENILAQLLDAARDAVPMQRAHNIQRLQNHQIESALQHFRFFGADLFSFVQMRIALPILLAHIKCGRISMGNQGELENKAIRYER